MDTDKILKDLNIKMKSATEVINLTEDEKKLIEIYKPQNSLIVYGTLAPGAPNHSVIAHIKGSWHTGIIKGGLKSEGWGAAMGYNGFIQTSIDKQKEIKVIVLFSEQLNDNWQMLDDFEGSGYRRILINYELDNGQTGIGNIYAISEDEQEHL